MEKKPFVTKEQLDEIDEFKYSRIPVYDENIDDIKGILFVKDILKPLKDNKEINIKELMREPYFVPESKDIDELFKEMQQNKVQIAIAIDEYGGTAGLITMEDILEELVGDIYDEYDEEEKEFEKIDENTYMLSGSLPIYDVNKLLDAGIPEGDYDTLSGYILEELGRIPKPKEKPVVETDKAIYKVEKFEDNRIVSVKICKVLEGEKEEEKE